MHRKGPSRCEGMREHSRPCHGATAASTEGRGNRWIHTREGEKVTLRFHRTLHCVQRSWSSSQSRWGNRRGHPCWQEGAIGRVGGYNGDGPVHGRPSFYRRHASGASRSSVRAMCSGAGALDRCRRLDGRCCNARRGWTKHNSCGFGTISTHLPTTPLDLGYARVAALHLPFPVLARAPTRFPAL